MSPEAQIQKEIQDFYRLVTELLRAHHGVGFTISMRDHQRMIVVCGPDGERVIEYDARRFGTIPLQTPLAEPQEQK